LLKVFSGSEKLPLPEDGIQVLSKKSGKKEKPTTVKKDNVSNSYFYRLRHAIHSFKDLPLHTADKE